MNNILVNILVIHLICIMPLIIIGLFNVVLTTKSKLSIDDFNNLSKDKSLVSILIPARNEALRITPLLESLIKQEKSTTKFEILILDDNSTDNTVTIAKDILSKYHIPYSIITGNSLPNNWLGKPYACKQLADAAQGSILLYLDADVILESDFLIRILNYRFKNGCDFISCFPRQICDTWLEKLVVPIFDLVLYTILPISLIKFFKSEICAAANGQCILIDKALYNRFGGHSAVKNEIIEDIALARVAKKNGAISAIIPGKGLISCRMYTSATEVIQGFGKNAFAVSSGSILGFLLICIIFTFIFLTPFLILPFNFFAIYGCLFLVILRMIFAIRFGHPMITSVLFHPLCIIASLGIALYSMYWHLTGVPVWKGRKLKI
jgi:glycosyltransferase involved in cell wall biosynthesis